MTRNLFSKIGLAGALALGVVGCNKKPTPTPGSKPRTFTYVEVFRDSKGDFTVFTVDNDGNPNQRIGYVDLDNDLTTAEELIIYNYKNALGNKVLISQNITRYEGSVGIPTRIMTQEEENNANFEYESLMNGVKTKEGYPAGVVQNGAW